LFSTFCSLTSQKLYKDCSTHNSHRRVRDRSGNPFLFFTKKIGADSPAPALRPAIIFVLVYCYPAQKQANAQRCKQIINSKWKLVLFGICFLLFGICFNRAGSSRYRPKPSVMRLGIMKRIIQRLVLLRY
jgi:hypothetical protein